ncbi:transposase, Mutator family protein [Mycobacterium ulcerans str. Harvey]|uniref:Transposase, Mutator family protein n=1 Tax=Mycobacterium ulcerans str. Harvey TaxID=1299332 RepID=A0ABN0RA67_MYCUL|nr:transposase, Mutator family protein [Mycobacterium ulcerans str. Harvey]
MGTPLPSAIRLWRTAWNEFIPFLDYDTEIRKVICSTMPLNRSTPATAVRSGRVVISHRAVRPEMPILGHPVARSTEPTEAMDDALETSIERLRDHLRRPHAGSETPNRKRRLPLIRQTRRPACAHPVTELQCGHGNPCHRVAARAPSGTQPLGGAPALLISRLVSWGIVD